MPTPSVPAPVSPIDIGNSAGDVEAARSAAAADALHRRAERAVAAGDDVAGQRAVDIGSIAAIAAETADADHDVAGELLRQRNAAGDVEAARAAAAADRLEQERARIHCRWCRCRR